MNLSSLKLEQVRPSNVAAAASSHYQAFRIRIEKTPAPAVPHARRLWEISEHRVDGIYEHVCLCWSWAECIKVISDIVERRKNPVDLDSQLERLLSDEVEAQTWQRFIDRLVEHNESEFAVSHELAITSAVSYLTDAGLIDLHTVASHLGGEDEQETPC